MEDMDSGETRDRNGKDQDRDLRIKTGAGLWAHVF
jgi:hypothetical protein